MRCLVCCVLNREAAENVGRPDKALSPTFFNTSTCFVVGLVVGLLVGTGFRVCLRCRVAGGLWQVPCLVVRFCLLGVFGCLTGLESTF